MSYNFIEKINSANVQLYLENGKLKYRAPSDALTEELRDEINHHREEITQYLEQKKLMTLPLTSTADREFYHSTHIQKQLWFLHKLNPNSAVYNMPISYHCEGHLDLDAFKVAIQLIVEHHSELRTIFFEDEQDVKQVIIPINQFTLDFKILEFNNKKEQNIKVLVKQSLYQEAIKCFNLTTGPLFRVRVIRVSENDFYILIIAHHIIADGWSINLLLNKLSKYYAQIHQKKIPDEMVKLKYTDYAESQAQLTSIWLMEEKLKFWRHYLADFAHLDFPLDKRRPIYQSFTGLTLQKNLPISFMRNIHYFAQEHGMTTYTIMLAAFNICLAKYTGQYDLILGIPLANRIQKNVADIFGCFVNSLPYRAKLSSEKNFLEILTDTQNNLISLQENQEISFEILVNQFQMFRDPAQNPLFQILFEMQNNDQEFYLEDAKCSEYFIETYISKFDITFTIINSNNLSKINIEYNTDLFNQTTVERFYNHYVTLLERLVAKPFIPIKAISILTDTEKKLILFDWNNTNVDFPLEKTAYQIFEEKVKNNPQAIAVTCHGISLTYEQLDNKANQLAHFLINHGVGKENLIILMLNRSNEYLICMLGVWKAGGAFVPLDPLHPNEKNRRILQQVDFVLLLTNEIFTENIQFIVKSKLIFAIEPLLAENKTFPCLAYQSGSEHLAYIIFTSGSTGLPKGAMVTHKGMLNHLLSKVKDLSLTPADHVAQIATQIFDVSVWQFMAALLAGGKVSVYVDEAAWEPIKLLNAIEQDKITIFESVPAHMLILLEELSRVTSRYDLSSLRWFIMNGEPLHPDLCRRWFKLYPSVPMINAYGPTECSDDVTHYKLLTESSIKNYWNYVPISGTLPNMRVYILDNDMNPVPLGAKGILYIEGVGVGRGYFNDPIKTADSFFSSPFNKQLQIYKTGDLVRYRENGEIEFLSRVDNQIKIRGFRIELGEVESRLNEYPDIVEAVVKCYVVSETTKHLVGYVQPREGVQLTTNTIRRFLLEVLPDYMVPSLFIITHDMPLTPSGKIDRQALKEPNLVELLEENIYAPPTTAEERLLVKIWSQILKIDPAHLGVHHNFFELGGDSIISIQIIAKARELGIHITLREIFTYQTIHKLAQLAIVNKNSKNILNLEQGLVNGDVKLTPIHRWLIDAHNGLIPNHYNQSIALDFVNFDKNKFEDILIKLVQHHDAFRLKIRYCQDKGWILYHSDIDQLESCYAINETDFKNHSYPSNQITKVIKEHDRGLQEGLNLQSGPVLRVGLYFLTEQLTRVVFIIHHFIIDGVSWRILLDDLSTLYATNTDEPEKFLSEKTTSFKSWSDKLQDYAFTQQLRDQIPYWAKQLTLPINNFIPVKACPYGATETIEFNGDHFFIHQSNNKLSILLSALGLALRKWTDCQKSMSSFLIGLEGHGREEIIPNCDLSRTVGWFTTIFPLLLTIPDTENIHDVLNHVQQLLKAIPDHGIGFGILKYITCEKSIIKASNKPSVLFNYLGQFDTNQTDLIRFSKIEPENNIDSEVMTQYPIEINIFIKNDQLRIHLIYMKEVFTSNSIRELLNHFMNYLQKITLLEHKQISSQYFSCYFPLAGITNQGQLDILIEQIKKINGWNKEYHQVVTDIYPLTPLQEGMLYHHQLNQTSDEYFIQIYYKLEGEINPTLMKQAWEWLIAQHSVFRTGFLYTALTRPIQYVVDAVNLTWLELDWSTQNRSQWDLNLQQYLSADRKIPFNLQKPPLLRCTLIKLSAKCYQFVLSNHHIILDGWCLPILINQLLASYTQLFLGKKLLESTRNAPYRNYIEWLKMQNKTKGQDYWTSLLQDFNHCNQLGDLSRIQKLVFSHNAIENHTIKLSYEYTQFIYNFLNRYKLTWNTLIQTCWTILLFIYSGDNDIVFGSITSGRPAELPGIQEMIGLFINTIPVRAKLSAEKTIIDLLRELQEQFINSREHDYISLADIQAWIGMVETGLFQTLLIFENYPTDDHKAELISISDFEARERTNYPLTAFASVRDQFVLKLDYNEACFSTNYIQGLLHNFKLILEKIVNYPNKVVVDFPKLLFSDNSIGQVSKTPPKQHYLHNFREQVRLNPNNKAVVTEKSIVSYETLNKLVNQLSQVLQKIGVIPNTMVGLYGENSLNNLIAMLSIFKLGAAYLPLNYLYPKERIDYILKDSGAKIIIGNNLPKHLLNGENQLVELNEFKFSENYLQSETEVEHNLNSIAYCIYTSGTTGKPKGVLITQENLAAFLSSMQEILDLSCKDTVLWHTSLSFDISILETLLPLTTGATIVIAENEIRNQADKVMALVKKYGITLMQATPSTWQMIQEFSPTTFLPNKVISGGEPLTLKLADWLSHHSNQAYNCYGPTEATIWSSCAKLSSGALITIGTPLTGWFFYILDSYKNPVPIGVKGELYIGGIGLASGYLNHAELNKQRFIHHCTIAGKELRLYRTGDLVKRISNQDIVFIGRNDDQFKIRGFRIELEEIQHYLMNHPDIAQCVLTVNEMINKDKKLELFYISYSGKELNLYPYFKKFLPTYMLPDKFYHLSKMPLTANGKLDYSALKLYSTSNKSIEQTDFSKLSDHENWLIHSIAKIMELESHNIRPTDNFFNLGGHSLHATIIVSSINQFYDINLPISIIFDNPIITDLAKCINGKCINKEDMESILL